MSKLGATLKERASSRPAAPSSGSESRLLPPKAAAAYLGYKSTAILAHVPVSPVFVSLDGRRRQPRYDRRALDAYLDGLSGFRTAQASGADGALETEVAETEFAAWQARRVGAS